MTQHLSTKNEAINFYTVIPASNQLFVDEPDWYPVKRYVIWEFEFDTIEI